MRRASVQPTSTPADGLPAALSRLRVDPRQPHAPAATPRAGQHAGRAAEVGDHPAGATTGHTLPRSMGPIGSIAAVFLAVIARHAAVETSVSPRT